MRFKVTIEKKIIEILKKIKYDAYGEDASRVRNAFILSQIILEKSYKKDEIDAALKTMSKENYGEKIATTMNFNSKAYEELKKMSTEFSYPMAEIVRATILIRYNKKDDIRTNTSKLDFFEKLNFQFHDMQLKSVLKEKNHILKIFRFWNAKFKKPQIIEECENSKQAKELYKNLGWDNFQYFDIINSFWNSFLCTAAIICSEENRPLFKFTEDKSQVEYDKARINENACYITNIVKQYIVEPYMDFINNNAKHCGARTDDKVRLMELILKCSTLNQYAKLIYTLSNFTPVPDNRFNKVKGSVARDSLPLMLEIIEQCIIEGKDLKVGNESIDANDLKLWKKWFVDNRENAMLEDYYFVVEDKIIAIKEFRTQSISHQLPNTKEELEEFFTIKNMRMFSRKQRMAEK